MIKRRLTVREVAEDADIGRARVHTMFTENLLRHLCLGQICTSSLVRGAKGNRVAVGVIRLFKYKPKMPKSYEKIQ